MHYHGRDILISQKKNNFAAYIALFATDIALFAFFWGINPFSSDDERERIKKGMNQEMDFLVFSGVRFFMRSSS